MLVVSTDLQYIILTTLKKYQSHHAKASTSFNNMITTEISKADTFYRAEEYHQQYIQKELY